MTASQQQTEHVLVVPTLLFHEIGHFQGFTENTEPYLKTLLDPAYTRFEPRDRMEDDPGYKQLIPYCLFRCGERLFHYKRGKKQGEGRLRSKRSVGIGGHISADDRNGGESPYLEGMRREIEEEVELAATCTQQCVGLINDDETEVGRVHLGIVHLFELDSPKVRPREESITETGFATPAELVRESDAFESWSRICLESLFGDSGTD